LTRDLEVVAFDLVISGDREIVVLEIADREIV